jgi:hypothetical protein
MFLKIYLASTFFKKRSLLAHCKTIHYDLTQLVDNCMRYFMCDFLTLPALIEFTMIFLSDGIRALYRYLYAIVKSHKLHMKTLTDPKTFLKDLQTHAQAHTDQDLLKQYAFARNSWTKV